MKKCMELEENLKTMDREISVNPQYVQKVNICECRSKSVQLTCYQSCKNDSKMHF